MAPLQFPVVSDVLKKSKQQQKIPVRQDPLIQAMMRTLTKVLGKGLLGGISEKGPSYITAAFYSGSLLLVLYSLLNYIGLVSFPQG